MHPPITLEMSQLTNLMNKETTRFEIKDEPTVV